MKRRILLVEDNARLAGMLQTFLESLGHEVRSLADAEGALLLLGQEKIDLLVLDLKLGAMNGVELLQRVRRNPELKELPVIIMTGVFRGEGYARAAAKLGVKAYLEKPFGKEAFLEAVKGALAPPPVKRELFSMLLDLYHNGKSGVLQLGGGTRVVLLAGEPASFSSPRFVPFLVAEGHLLRSDLEKYPLSRPGKLPLCEAGLLSYDELQEQSRLFLSRILIEAVLQNQPPQFLPDLGAIEPPLTPLCLPRLLHQAAKQGSDRFAAGSFLEKAAPLYPLRTQQYYRLANLLGLGPEEIGILEQLGQGKKVREIFVPGGTARQAWFLDFLVRMGMVNLALEPGEDLDTGFPQKMLFNRPIEEVVEVEVQAMSFDDLVDEVSDSIDLAVGDTGMAAPLSASEIDFEQEVQRDYAAIQNKNYYEIFGLTQGNFSFASLKDSYFSKTRQYSPEKFMQLSGDTLSRAQDVLSHYANAYNTLSSVIAKERYDEMLNANVIGLAGRQDDALQARIQFQSGKVFLEMEDYNNAERALQDAYTLDAQDSQTSAYLAWSIYKNPANHGSQVALEKCRMLLSKSLQMGRSAEAFAFRGWMLLDEGRDGLAEGEFQKALKLNPQEQHALGGMRLIRERREAEKKGLFKRIFG
ncbi:DNA-binding response regulator KdpE [Citrifermentans bremense]|uniref:DNA-binding response regulator KdpE n=1 Tax=Citrifermentans bremense TaxID=60035 RepID=A0A6S6LYF4_9BACT|nr:response regulator [Citrifermentans bremense]BCG45940.1 DNA-binding response regulator KdpE [Citrifermentans bremense]